MDSAWKTRVLILGGGFAGLTVAMELEKTLGRYPSGRDYPRESRELLPVHAHATRGGGQRP